MNILVTGSAGLLGTSLKKILKGNHVFHTRQDCDLTDYEKTKEFFIKKTKENKIDTVIHTAALVGGVKANMNNNENFFYQNYKINHNVLDICFHLGISNFVNVLSTCIFPNENINYPLTPNQIDLGDPHNSNYGYSFAKRLSGYETKIFRKINNKNWFSVVPTNLYGPNDNFNLENSHLIPGLIHRAFLSKKNNTKFVVWGDGSPLRQFVYSDDLAKLILWSLENWKSEEHCMLTNESEIPISHVVELIRQKFDISNEDVIYDTNQPKGQFRKPAISNVKDFEFKSLEDGINETIEWFLQNYNTLRK